MTLKYNDLYLSFREYSPSVISEFIKMWMEENKPKYTPVKVRQLLLQLLDKISSDTRWFTRAQYKFLSSMSVRKPRTVVSSSGSGNGSVNGTSANSNIGSPLLLNDRYTDKHKIATLQSLFTNQH